MKKPRLKMRSARDLKYFLSWSSLATFTGTVALLVLEFDALPASWPLNGWLAENRVLALLVVAFLIVLPPPLSQGLQRLRTREEVTNSMLETKTVVRGLGNRASNLILKIREGFSGETDNTYQHHLLDECKHYFESRIRSGPEDDADGHVRVEAAYYAAVVKKNGKLLERKLFTDVDPSEMRSNFSSRGSAENVQCVESIFAGKHVYCRDLRDEQESHKLAIRPGVSRRYRSFLSIPVLKDRKAAGDKRILGMLSVNATHTGVLSESDRHVLEVYAWFLAAAYEVDAHAKTRTEQ